MHPLSTYLRNLRIAAANKAEYDHRIKHLSETTGISTTVLIRLHYPSQARLSPRKALLLELFTNGQVPADSVCLVVNEVISLVERVVKMRENNQTSSD